MLKNFSILVVIIEDLRLLKKIPFCSNLFYNCRFPEGE